MAYKGIDVSKYQGEINWEKVKECGVEFAVIRSGYGRELSQKDPYFEQNCKGAKAAGLRIGTYWYSYAESAEDAKTEAKAFLEAVKGKTFDLPVYYDVEENAQAQKGKEFVTGVILAFTEEVKKAGYTPGVYANTNWLKNYIDRDKLGNMSIWKADYLEQSGLCSGVTRCYNIDISNFQSAILKITQRPFWACLLYTSPPAAPEYKYRRADLSTHGLRRPPPAGCGPRWSPTP